MDSNFPFAPSSAPGRPPIGPDGSGAPDRLPWDDLPPAPAATPAPPPPPPSGAPARPGPNGGSGRSGENGRHSESSRNELAEIRGRIHRRLLERLNLSNLELLERDQ